MRSSFGKRYLRGFFDLSFDLSSKCTLLVIGSVAIAVVAVAAVGYREVHRATTENIDVRIDRAARTAAALLERETGGALISEKTASGSLLRIRVAEADRPFDIRPNERFDALVEEIGRVNQGAANLFRFDAERNAFERIATTLRGPNGEYVRTVYLGSAHPAFATIVESRTYLGPSPVNGRMRQASITPILAAKGELIGVMAVDVGWVDDLWRVTLELQYRLAGAGLIALLVIGSLGGLLFLRAMHPLREIAAYAEGVAREAEVGPAPYLGRSDEVGALAGGMARVVEMRRRLENLAYKDMNTGCANAAGLKTAIRRDFAREGGPAVLGLVLVGVDRFRPLVDAYGHRNINLMLRRMAHVIGARMPPGSILARVGPSEFVIASADLADEERTSAFAAALIDALCQPYHLPRGAPVGSVSIGAHRLDAGADLDEALRNAGLALTKAKLDGRRQLAFYTHELDEALQRETLIEAELRAAIPNGGLSVHFQPQVHLQTSRVHGLEALVRWSHPTLGPVSPAEFVPIAEREDLIVALGDFVLDESCRMAAAWTAANVPFGHVSVNVSPSQIWRADFAEKIAETLARHNLAAQTLCLEITEAVFMNPDVARIQNHLARLRALGVGIALDDFGTGYSSLSYLQNMPLTQLKIDRSFVRSAHTDARKRRVLAGIADLARSLDLEIVAEGVETGDELAVVASLGCDNVQGYFYAKPSAGLLIPAEIARLSRLQATEEAPPITMAS